MSPVSIEVQSFANGKILTNKKSANPHSLAQSLLRRKLSEDTQRRKRLIQRIEVQSRCTTFKQTCTQARYKSCGKGLKGCLVAALLHQMLIDQPGNIGATLI